MLTMRLSQWTTNQGTYMVTICTFIKSNKVATPHFLCVSEIKWRFQGFPCDLLVHGAHPHNTGLWFLQPDHLFIHRAQSNQQAGHTATVGRLHCIQSWKFVQERKIKSLGGDRSSSQLLRASGQSGGIQVTLEFSHCTSVQGAKVEVKSSVCDVEVSRLFNEVHNLWSRENNENYFCSHL